MAHYVPYLVQVTEPAEEPVTLAEAKLFLKIDGDEENEVVTRLIAAARIRAEQYLRRSLVSQTWKMAYDGYAPAHIELMRGPVQSVAQVKIISRDGSETIVDSANYYLSADKAKLCFDISAMGHLVEVSYIAGFGDAAKIPAAIKQGILMHVAQMFENRESVVLGHGALSLFDSFRSIML
jgi:uncharacterized phiE125 gp8 family phage protein